MLCIREINASAFPVEEEVARRWWSLPPRSLLPLSNGDAYQLLFAGRPGGAAGPDVRDAVLCDAHPRLPLLAHDIRNVTQARRYVGDVEFHIRSSDWVAHRHHSDPRYNNVILHVVLLCDDPAPTTRQDGLHVPVCSLYDLPSSIDASPLALQDKTSWPCHYCMNPEERDRLLEHAGLLRFEQKAHAFVEQLHASTAAPPYDLYTTCLLPALAEGLGYGRDRAFFRALGQRLLGKGELLPEPLGRAAAPAPLDAGRMRSLHLLARRGPGLWQRLRSVIESVCMPVDEQTELPVLSALPALRAVFCETGLSVARTDILICNIVLPFAAAVALLEGDTRLNKQAQAFYSMHPGLPSNSVTRMMSAQLQLPAEPSGSCRQQGLHYVYRETCQEKRCELCMMGRRLSL